MLLLKIAAVFGVSASIGVLYRIPRSSLAYASGVGVVAWLIMYAILQYNGNIIFADFGGSIVIGLLAEGLARWLKKPATIFVIPGFIPLVPGGDAYTTMVHMVQGRFVEGVAMGMQTALSGGAIAFGIFISSTVCRLLLRYKMEKQT